MRVLCAKTAFKDYVVYNYLTREDILAQIEEPNEDSAYKIYSEKSSAGERLKKRKVKIIWISILAFILAIFAVWRLIIYFEPGNIAIRKISNELTTNFPYTEQTLSERKIYVGSIIGGSGIYEGTGIVILFRNFVTKEQYIEITNYFFDFLQYQQENRSAIKWIRCRFIYPQDEIAFEYTCIAEESETNGISDMKTLASADRNASRVKLYRSGQYGGGFIPINPEDLDGYIEYTCVNMVEGYSLDAPRNISIKESTQPEKIFFNDQSEERRGVSFAVTLGDDVNWAELTFTEKIQVVNWMHKHQTQFLGEDDTLIERFVITVYDSVGNELFTMKSNEEYIKDL